VKGGGFTVTLKEDIASLSGMSEITSPTQCKNLPKSHHAIEITATDENTDMASP